VLPCPLARLTVGAAVADGRRSPGDTRRWAGLPGTHPHRLHPNRCICGGRTPSGRHDMHGMTVRCVITHTAPAGKVHPPGVTGAMRAWVVPRVRPSPTTGNSTSDHCRSEACEGQGLAGCATRREGSEGGGRRFSGDSDCDWPSPGRATWRRDASATQRLPISPLLASPRRSPTKDAFS
jgi:hypothetical protein